MIGALLLLLPSRFSTACFLIAIRICRRGVIARPTEAAAAVEYKARHNVDTSIPRSGGNSSSNTRTCPDLKMARNKGKKRQTLNREEFRRILLAKEHGQWYCELNNRQHGKFISLVRMTDNVGLHKGLNVLTAWMKVFFSLKIPGELRN